MEPTPAMRPADVLAHIRAAHQTVDPIARQLADATDVDGAADADEHADRDLIDLIALTEQLRNQIDAIQAHAEVEFQHRQLARQRAAGVTGRKLGTGIPEQIALARSMNPSTVNRELAQRSIIVQSMPALRRTIADGQVPVKTAQEAARAVAVLNDEDRARVDAQLDGQLTRTTPRRAYEHAVAAGNSLDPHSSIERVRRNVATRRVTIRPLDDGIAQLTAVLPSAEAAACYTQLTKAAAAAKAQGDSRSHGAIMADTLIQQTLGVPSAAGGAVEIQLLMTDRALLAAGDDPAEVEGIPIPAHVAQHLALSDDNPDSDPGPRYIRRLYTDPDTGHLTAADQRKRSLPESVRAFIRARDQECRMPGCDSPIRHIDHVERWADGGETSAENSVGVCERFNYVKEIPGWSTELLRDTINPKLDGALRIITPTGHEYTSPVPPLRSHRT